MRARLTSLVIAAALVILAAVPASAITYGTPTGAAYGNVGAIVTPILIPVFDEAGNPVVNPDGDQELEEVLVQWCSGTLIEQPDVFLTAAHCLMGLETLYVSFANPLPLDERGFVQDGPHLIGNLTAHPHPDAFSGGGDWKDIGVIKFANPVPGITPADLPDENLLGRMGNREFREARFTAVGYGALRDDHARAWQSLRRYDGNRYQVDQSPLSLTKQWFTLSMNPRTGSGGTCYGDSGGPHFLADTVVSITVTGDVWCKASDKTYRIDTGFSLEFIRSFLD